MAPLDSFELRERRTDLKTVVPAAEPMRPPRREPEIVRVKPGDSKLLMYAAGLAIAAITVLTKPTYIATKEPTAAHVWYYGYIPS
jgi:hypothetical protein